MVTNIKCFKGKKMYAQKSDNLPITMNKILGITKHE